MTPRPPSLSKNLDKLAADLHAERKQDSTQVVVNEYHLCAECKSERWECEQFSTTAHKFVPMTLLQLAEYEQQSAEERRTRRPYEAELSEGDEEFILGD